MNMIKNLNLTSSDVSGFLFLSDEDLKASINSKIISIVPEESINRFSTDCMDESICFDANNKFITNPAHRKIYRIGLSYDFIFDYETYNYDIPDDVELYDLTKYAIFLDVIDLDAPNMSLVEEFSKTFPEIAVTSEQHRKVIQNKNPGMTPSRKVRRRMLKPTFK